MQDDQIPRSWESVENLLEHVRDLQIVYAGHGTIRDETTAC